MLELYFDAVAKSCPNRWQGRVSQVIGHLLESDGPFCSVGECCEVETAEQRFAGEIVGFRAAKVLSMCLQRPQGIRYGDRIVAWGQRPVIRVGDALLGRVIDAVGDPLDGKGSYASCITRMIDGAAPAPLERLPIREPLGCGVRAIDGFLTCGRGQRMGIFGGSGVGKSTLVGMMARGTSADLTVLALVGERGREVGEFLEELGPEGRGRSVVVVSTSDQSPLLRVRAALAATSIAEHFCAQGKQVLLVVDSLTRFAMAQREIGLAAGEPPTAKGYTPSVFTLLSRLVERAGRFDGGSITAFYSVLMEGDDEQDPLVDAVRALLDGHIVLDRQLTSRGHYPPISILNSLSRLMPAVSSDEHRQKAGALRSLLALYARSEDLIRVGAYQKGTDPQLDVAIAALPKLDAFLRQDSSQTAPLQDNIRELLQLAS
ncbi:MAG TPA: FliI/YscN family ATPase [Terriglobales bacterium]|nr:FliI/YscN family ATPase [Terriglobales bacterium]